EEQIVSKTVSPGFRNRSLFRPRPESGRPFKSRIRIEYLEDRTLLNVATALQNVPFYLPPQHELFNLAGFLTEPARADAQAIARTYLYGHTADLGITPADLSNAILTRNYVSDLTGTTHLTWQQSLNSLPVANANLTINVTAGGQVINVGGGFAANLSLLVQSSSAPLLTPLLP